MKLSDLPIFRKDLRVLLGLMAWLLVLQWLPPTGLAIFFWIEDLPDLMLNFSEMAVATQWMAGSLLGLVAAAYVTAEEQSAGTEIFLRRLPTSRLRVYTEKIAAGLTTIAAFWLCQAAFNWVSLPLGGLWAKAVAEGGEFDPMPGVAIGTVLIAICLSCYLVGLLVSLIARQTLVIVLAGYAVWATGLGFVVLALDNPVFLSRDIPWTWDLAWINLVVSVPLLVVPLLMALPGRRFRFPRASRLATGGGRMVGLVWKSVVENSLLQVLAFLFLVAALLTPSLVIDFRLVAAAGLLIVAALGTAAYAPLEKQGLHCVLYQHPVPRSHLFWAKTIAAVLPVLAVSTGVFLLWNRTTPMPMVTSVALTAFVYTCAVLVTLTFQAQITALLATVGMVTMSLIYPPLFVQLWVEFRSPFVTLRHYNWGFGSGAGDFVVYLGAAVPMTLLAIGCLVAARQMATDRAVLTGPAGYRQARFAGLFALVMSVSALLTMAVWGDVTSFLTRG